MPIGNEFAARLNPVPRIRIATISSLSCGALAIDKVRVLPFVSVAMGELSVKLAN